MTSTTQKRPVWFWIISVLALVWNAMGANAYLQQAYDTESYRAMYSKEQLEIAANMPAWVTAAFAIAVFGGIFGSILLFLRKKLASTVFLVSLLAVLIQMGYTIINGYTSDIYMTILIIVAAILIYWFAKHSVKKNWLS